MALSLQQKKQQYIAPSGGQQRESPASRKRSRTASPPLLPQQPPLCQKSRGGRNHAGHDSLPIQTLKSVRKLSATFTRTRSHPKRLSNRLFFDFSDLRRRITRRLMCSVGVCLQDKTTTERYLSRIQKPFGKHHRWLNDKNVCVTSFRRKCDLRKTQFRRNASCQSIDALVASPKFFLFFDAHGFPRELDLIMDVVCATAALAAEERRNFQSNRIHTFGSAPASKPPSAHSNHDRHRLLRPRRRKRDIKTHFTDPKRQLICAGRIGSLARTLRRAGAPGRSAHPMGPWADDEDHVIADDAALCIAFRTYHGNSMNVGPRTRTSIQRLTMPRVHIHGAHANVLPAK